MNTRASTFNMQCLFVKDGLFILQANLKSSSYKFLATKPKVQVTKLPELKIMETFSCIKS